MHRTRVIPVAVGLMLALASCGGDDGGAAASATVTLGEQNASGITGTATLTEENGATTIAVVLQGAGTGPQPIHIHKGTCATLDPAPEYPLTDVTDGTSESTVNVTVASLQSGEFAINVHKSAQEAQTYVACGDIA